MKHQSAGQLFLLIVFTTLSGLFFYSEIPELCAIAMILSLYLIFGWAKFLDLTIAPKVRPYRTNNGFILLSTSQAKAEAHSKELELEHKDWFDKL